MKDTDTVVPLLLMGHSQILFSLSQAQTGAVSD